MKRLMTRDTPLPAVVFFCVTSKLAPLSHPRHRPVIMTVQNHKTNELDWVLMQLARLNVELIRCNVLPETV